jgi:hypothetical protein
VSLACPDGGGCLLKNRSLSDPFLWTGRIPGVLGIGLQGEVSGSHPLAGPQTSGSPEAVAEGEAEAEAPPPLRAAVEVQTAEEVVVGCPIPPVEPVAEDQESRPTQKPKKVENSLETEEESYDSLEILYV